MLIVSKLSHLLPQNAVAGGVRDCMLLEINSEIELLGSVAGFAETVVADVGKTDAESVIRTAVVVVETAASVSLNDRGKVYF